MKNKKILIDIEKLDNIFSNGIKFSDITTIKPMFFDSPASGKPLCLITNIIQKAKELGYTITINGEILKDEKQNQRNIT